MAAAPIKYSSLENSYQGSVASTSQDNSYQGSVASTSHANHNENTIPASNEEMTDIKTEQSIFMKFITHIRNLKLEMLAFLFAFSYTMTSVTSTTMILDKVCLVHLKYPSYICKDLENNTAIKSSVEKLATNYQLGHSLIQTAPAALLACFIGPWSDHYGRKFPIILAIFGMVLDGLGSIVCAYLLETRAEYYFIPAIFTGIFGGRVSILAVIYSYAADTTFLVKRTMKFGYLEMASGMGMALGGSAGGWLYELLGYPAVFFFSTGGLSLSLIWVVLLLEETRGLDNDDGWSIKLQNLFSCKTFKDSFIAIAKRRPHQGRKQVLLLIASMSFLYIAMNSTGDINYLYVHHQFGWGNAKYSSIIGIYSLITIGLLIIVIPLLKYYRVGDPILGLFGTISFLGKNVGLGLAWKEGVYHLANLFGLLAGVSPFAARSRISKVVSNDDLGKVFSFVAMAESLLPILASIVITQIFNATLQTSFPGTPYIIIAFFLLWPLGVFSWTCFLPKMSYQDISHITEGNPNTVDIPNTVDFQNST